MKAVLVILAIALGIALLYTMTLEQAGVSCEACMEFGGREQCGSARAANEADARRSAISTACAPLTRGVTETLDCERKVPRTLRCQPAGAEPAQPGEEAR